MLKWSVIITCMSYVFGLIYYLYYKNDGRKWKVLHTFYAILQQLSTSLIILLLIFLAKGWTIAVRKISRQGRLRISIYFTIYIWLSLASVIWKDYALDEFEGKYVTNNPPGIILIVLQCIVVIWFCYAIYTTNKNVHKKTHFYKKFFICVCIWFLLLICIKYIFSIKFTC